MSVAQKTRLEYDMVYATLLDRTAIDRERRMGDRKAVKDLNLSQTLLVSHGIVPASRDCTDLMAVRK
jgi:hypothetical protein